MSKVFRKSRLAGTRQTKRTVSFSGGAKNAAELAIIVFQLGIFAVT